MTTTYAVRSGDTLNALARRFGVSATQLAQTNNISNPNKINVGQKLVIPDGFDNKPASKPATSNAGDTFEAGAPSSAGAVRDSGGRTYPASADGTPMYKQSDAQWGGRSLGTGSSISLAGCATTSTAMAISKISGKAINPGELDAYLDRNKGYAGNGIMWDTAAKAAGLSASKSAWSLSTINKQIDVGRPVVVGVDYKAGSAGGKNGTDHWITITGRGKQNGKDVYFANDPATGSQITLSEQNGRLVGGPKNYKTTDELVTFSGGNPKPGTAAPSADTSTPPASPAANGASVKGMALPSGDLEKGARGAEVEKLQKALVKLGFMTQAEMNTGPGTFGPRTQSALKEFQEAHGVKNTGYYGPLTRQAFQKLGAEVGGSAAPSTGGTSGSGGTSGTDSTSGVTGPLPTTGNAFIDRVAADAIKSQRQTGVPASVTLAQALLESGAGKSSLATKGNNFFGIKGEGPAGHVTMPTKEYSRSRGWHTVNANFRKYNTPAESFADHGKFLRENKRYANAFKHTDDAAQFAREIHRAGYATDPGYADKLISIINKYDLQRFDQIGRQ
ncbi:glucosaminidase domain-containing protein [Archangium violaceum]|uniref:glucosaminidase domain-containing protein n=1 Tax=Archangium violaceum TaxID=83451 RepID=UPI00193B4214|nr:glucosaminidase domain-containing protein [Archangium violaceum]QRK07921.1 glucosaminidase domain-containing protein [Archangium violaceum]